MQQNLEISHVTFFKQQVKLFKFHYDDKPYKSVW
jgi:hypothetical protein